MGNVLRSLHKHCCEHTTAESQSLGPHGVSAQNAGVSAFARDLLHFEVTSQVSSFLFLFLYLQQISQSFRKRSGNFGWKIKADLEEQLVGCWCFDIFRYLKGLVNMLYLPRKLSLTGKYRSNLRDTKNIPTKTLLIRTVLLHEPFIPLIPVSNPRYSDICVMLRHFILCQNHGIPS